MSNLFSESLTRCALPYLLDFCKYKENLEISTHNSEPTLNDKMLYKPPRNPALLQLQSISKMETMALTSTKIINPSPITHQTKALVNKIPAAKQTHLTLKSGQNPTWSTLKTDNDRWFGASCVASNSGSTSVAAMEIITPEEEEELTQRREKCREKNALPELLECLETEAIMGEDAGKDPKDYNRRAKIFDKSSRIFQALKAQGNHKG